MEGDTPGPALPEAARHLGIADLLEHDHRAAFIVDLDPTLQTTEDAIAIVYFNASLRSNPKLGDQIRGIGESRKAWMPFRAWIIQAGGYGADAQDTQPTLAFCQTLWSRITLKNKWRVICANESDPWANKSVHIGLQNIKASRNKACNNSKGVPTGIPLWDTVTNQYSHQNRQIQKFSRGQDFARSTAESDPGRSLPSLYPEPTDYLDFVRSVDWASTPLGPMETWSAKLRDMCDLVMRDSRPAALYWGPKYVIIYNETYALLTGSKHPDLMGKPVVDGWPEACDALIATMEKSRSTGRSSVDEEWQLFLDRLDGQSEEVYLSWSVVPIFEGNDCLGFLHPVFETTSLRIGERRIAMLNNLGEALAKANDVNSFWHRTIEGLGAFNACDVPFAMLYSVIHGSTSGISPESTGSLSSSETRTFRLEGTLGVPKGHSSAPLYVDLSGPGGGLIACFRDAVRSSNTILLQTSDGSLPKDMLEGFQWRGFGDACTAAAICALRPTKDESVMGLLMIGLNPRRPFDEDYRQFLSLLSQKLGTSLASSVLFEEEIRRGRNAAEQAAFDRAWLSEQLALRTKEADDATRRFRALGEVVPVGLCFSTPEGHITYANDTWYDITGFDKSTSLSMNFMNCVAEQDVQMVTECWAQLITTGLPTTFEFRINSMIDDMSEGSTHQNGTSMTDTTSRTQSRVTEDMPGVSTDRSIRWVLATVTTDCAEDGTIEVVTTSLTDITIHKRSAEEALQRAQQAEQLSELLARFKRMADSATVGLFDLAPDGKVMQANDRFYDIIGVSNTDPQLQTPRPWLEYIVEEDLPVIEKTWATIAAGGKAIADEVRLKKPWVDEDAAGNPIVGETWILATAMPVKDGEGNTTGFTGCVTDISVQKAKAQIALERAELLDQVLIRTREAKSSEEKFARFAEAAPIGISIMDANGCINYCNETWFKITNHPRNLSLNQPFAWISQVEDEDLHIVQATWQRIITDHTSPTIEFRMKHPWDPPGQSTESGPPAPTWLMSSYFPEIDESGNVKSIMSCLSDISHFKWAESIQRQRTVEALESKRQQENFIDMTSHEMRNPLSAIVQCADLIVESLEDMRTISNENTKTVLDSSIDAAQTIISCAKHQKSIVDDILTLSKLDSDLLSVTPIAVNPMSIMEEALKMFAAEARRAEIKLSSAVDKSVGDLKVNWVLLDPSRLLQVLINLLTNALKFTQTGATRIVTATMSAFVERPSQKKTSISYIPTRSLRDDLLSVPSLRDGKRQQLYLHFTVQDTGRGLTDTEKKLLFKRFSQASARTHIQYGGSGLGLFISRELTELQGGEIGVASEPGVGSTFAFYVKTQRTSPPDDAVLARSTPPRGATNEMYDLAITVLVVEDNLINQAVLSKQLRNLGCTVHVANDGGEAIDYLKKTRYWKDNRGTGKDLEVMLLDIEMPVMDGLTCVGKIRELQNDGDIIRHIPIIAVSANARSEQITTAKAAGMDDIVVKPFRIPELIPKINILLERLRRQSIPS